MPTTPPNQSSNPINSINPSIIKCRMSQLETNLSHHSATQPTHSQHKRTCKHNHTTRRHKCTQSHVNTASAYTHRTQQPQTHTHSHTHNKITHTPHTQQQTRQIPTKYPNTKAHNTLHEKQHPYVHRVHSKPTTSHISSKTPSAIVRPQTP